MSTASVRNNLGVIKHREVCGGDKICVRCGRKTCENCHMSNDICVVCGKLYKEEEIELYPVPIWNSEENK